MENIESISFEYTQCRGLAEGLKIINENVKTLTKLKQIRLDNYMTNFNNEDF